MYATQSRKVRQVLNATAKPAATPVVSPAEEGVRSELVARVRAEIAAGTYDSPERWDAALDALAARLL